MAMATGEHIDGDVNQQVKEDVGVEILPPYLPNPKKINQNEIPMLEIGARIKGFDPKNPIHIAAVCHLQSKEEAQSIERAVSEAGKGPKTALGPEQNARPKEITGSSFNRDFTCYPRPPGCGRYVTTISAEADHLRTDAQMQNYIIDKEILEQRLLNYAESHDKVIRSETEINSIINEIYSGQLGSYKSLSDKGAIKAVMATQPVSLIGVDSETELTLRAGVENVMNGWIMSLNSVEIIIPEYFTPMDEFCPGWNREGNRIRLSSEYLSATSFKQVLKGEQKVFPSCHLIPKQDIELTEPTEANYLMLVDYNYIVQKEEEIEIRNATGGPCPTTTTSGGSAGTSKAPSNTTGSTNQTTRSATDACAGKTEGQDCSASNQKCLNKAGQLTCVPQCEYSAAKGLNELTTRHACVTPQTACIQGTVRSPSCTSDWTTGSYYCCQR
jgi:hypothetical protein